MLIDFKKQWPLYCVSFCASLAISVFGFWIFSHYWFKHKTVDVFVEMKVIDEDGHPVAGAQIFRDKVPIGVTDAFGEWNQFLHTPIGSSIPLFVRKKNGKTVSGAWKTIEVPKSILLDADTRIKANVHF